MYYDDFIICPQKGKSADSGEIQELVSQRNRFLSDNPDLMAVQEEIDRLLGTTFDPVLRLEILFMLISNKLDEMREIFEEVLNLAELVVKE